ncbi:hypothetical protein JBE04_24480 [Streptomyces sp. PRKS01-29]|nr:hypothetical protein [Streptomyces sabulosicollis]
MVTRRQIPAVGAEGHRLDARPGLTSQRRSPAAGEPPLGAAACGCRLDGGPEALLARLGEPERRERIAAELRTRIGRTFLPEGIILAAMPPGRYSRWNGSSVQRIATAVGRDPVHVSLGILRAHANGVRMSLPGT